MIKTAAMILAFAAGVATANTLPPTPENTLPPTMEAPVEMR